MAIKIKVCGMRELSNIGELVKLNPDYIGFIFYPKSKRYIGAGISDEILKLIPESVQKTGVFVDEPIDSVIEKFIGSKLDIVQLHGGEPADYCQRLKDLKIPVIKVFSISSDFNFETIAPYDSCCDNYLFDTASELRGGTGIKFNWEILSQYKGSKPFFLSGGIQPSDIEAIKNLKIPNLYAIDLNSGFETAPGLKDISKLQEFIEAVRM